MEAVKRLKPPLLDAIGARGSQHQVTLWRKDMRHVALDVFAPLASFVKTIDEQQGTSRHECLPQHEVQQRIVPMLQAQMRIHPVPCLLKYNFSLHHVRVQQLNSDNDGYHVERVLIERVHNDLRQQRGFASGWAGSEESSRRREFRLSTATLRTTGCMQPTNQCAGIGDALQLAIDVNGNALLQHVQAIARNGIHKVAMSRAKIIKIPGAQNFKLAQWHLTRAVVPRVKCPLDVFKGEVSTIQTH